MPTRGEIRDALAILTAGRVIPAAVRETQRYRSETALLREAEAFAPRARAAAQAGLRGGKFAVRHGVTKNPWGVAALLAYEGYIHRDEIADVAESLLAGEGLPGGNGAGIAKKRAISKANKAVKQGMAILKAGTKASTGADKGVMPAGAFKTATKAAGLANPKTPSKITGKGKVKNLARKIKRWW